MTSKREKYTVKKALPHRGRVYQPGEQIELHPREAKYLLGMHLERPGTQAGKAKALPGAKSKGGDE